MRVTIDADGPLFNGKAARIIRDYTNDAEKDIARYALDAVRQNFHTRFRNPTGNYERHVNISRSGNGTTITDNGIVYGPWLEGISSRNRSTRFRGYHSFEDASEQTDRRALAIAETTLRSRWLRKLD